MSDIKIKESSPNMGPSIYKEEMNFFSKFLIVTGIVLMASLGFLQFAITAGAPDVPFFISEHTVYDIAENTVFLEFTDNIDKAQYITNISFIFADSSKTRTIDVHDFALNQSYVVEDYGSVNISLGKYSKVTSNCTDVNMTSVCTNYYESSNGELMCSSSGGILSGCDYVLADKSILKAGQGVIGSHMAYDYFIVPNVKEKLVTDGLKIEQKVSGSVPLAKGGSAQIRIAMPHILFYGINVDSWENKYNITACSQYGCAELDPYWYSGGCGNRTNITYTGGAGLVDYPTNFTLNVSNILAGGNTTNLRLVDSTNVSIPFTTITPLQNSGGVPIIPNTTFVHNYTESTDPYQLYACSDIGQATYYNLSSFGNESSTNWDYGTDEALISGGGWTDGGCKFTNDYFYSGSTKGNMSMSLAVGDCGASNIIPTASTLGKWQFRFIIIGVPNGGELFRANMREPAPVYSSHHQFRVGGTTNVLTIMNAGASTAVDTLTGGVWYLVENIYNTTVARHTWIVSNSTWQYVGDFPDYQNTDNFVRELMWQGTESTAYAVIDDIWQRSYSTHLNLTWSVGAMEEQFPPVVLYPVFLGGLSNITYDASLTPYCYSPGSTCSLFRNGTAATNNTAIILAANNWNYSATETGGNETWSWVTVNKKAYTFTLSPTTQTITYPTTVLERMLSNDTVAASKLTLWRNDTNITALNNTNEALGAGFWRFSANSTLPEANYSYTNQTSAITVNKYDTNNAHIVTFVWVNDTNGLPGPLTDANQTVEYPYYFSVIGIWDTLYTDVLGDNVLYRNGSLIGLEGLPTELIDTTSIAATACNSYGYDGCAWNRTRVAAGDLYNYTLVAPATQNFTEQSRSIFLNVTKRAFTFGLSPANGTVPYGTLSYKNATSNDTAANSQLTFWRNETNITLTNGTSEVHSVGYWEFVANSTRPLANYSWSAVLNNLTVTGTNVTFISQTPADLTSFNIMGSTLLNITYNITGTSTDASKTFLYYKTNTTLDDNTYYINGVAYAGFFNSYNKSNATFHTFSFYMDDNDVYPGTYPIAFGFMYNTSHSVQTLNTPGASTKTQLTNVSFGSQYGFVEIMANNTTAASGPLRIYTCNQTYSTGSVATNANCAQIYSLPAGTAWNHTHNMNSSHIVVPYGINTTTKEINGIRVTPNMSIIARSSPSSNWNQYYIPNDMGSSFTSTNSGGSWSGLAGTFDVHMHQFNDTSTLYYYLCTNTTDTVNLKTCSAIRSDLLQLGGIPPNAPNVYLPVEGIYANNSNMSINWTASISPNGYNVTSYNISLRHLNNTEARIIQSNNSDVINYDWTMNGNGMYFIKVCAFDNRSQYSCGDSFNFTISLTPIYIGGLSNITYDTSLTPYCYSPSGITCALYRNGTAATNNTAITLPVGNWNYSANVTGGNQTSVWVTVNKKAFVFGLSPPNGTITYPTLSYENITSNDTQTNSQMRMWRNNTVTGGATDTVGNTSDFWTMSYTDIIATPINSTISGQVSTLGFNVQSAVNSVVVIGLYSTNSSNLPDALLGYSSPTTINPTGWYDIPISSTNVTAGEKYWIVTSFNQTGNKLYGPPANPPGDISSRRKTYTYNGALPASWGSDVTTSNFILNVRMTMNESTMGLNLNGTSESLSAGYWEFVANSSRPLANYSWTAILNNVTVDKSYVTVQGSPLTQAITYEAALNQQCTTNSTLHKCSLWRGQASPPANNITGLNNTNEVLPAGVWYFNATVEVSQNITGDTTAVQTITVNKKSVSAFLTINGTAANAVYFNRTVSNVTAWFDYATSPVEGSVSLRRNGTLTTNPEIAARDIGGYIYDSGLDAFNYSSSNSTFTLEILPDMPIQPIITYPANSTYYSPTLTSSFSATEDNALAFSLILTLDGAVVYSNPAYVNNTVVTQLLTPLSAGPHNLVLNGSNIAHTSYYNTTFMVLFGTSMNLSNANGTAMSGWSVNVSNSSSSVLLTGFNNGAFINNSQLPSGATVTFNASSDSRFGTASQSVTPVNGITNLTMSVYRLQQFKALDDVGGAINTFFVSFSNGTASSVTSTSSGTNIIQWPLDRIVLGSSINTTATSFGYANSSKIYNFNLSSEINDTFTFALSGSFTQVIDENSLQYVRQYKVQMANGTFNVSQSYQNYFTVGKGGFSGFSGLLFDLPFLDDSSVTSQNVGGSPDYSQDLNRSTPYTYAFGKNLANFSIDFQMQQPSTSNYDWSGNITIAVLNTVTGQYESVYTNKTSIVHNVASGVDGGRVTRYFTVNNTNNKYGDYPTFVMNITNLPLIQAGYSSLYGMQVNVYEITLVSPYTYNVNGQADVKFSLFNLPIGITRMLFTSPAYTAVNRVYYIYNSVTASTIITAYMSSLCYAQNWLVQTAGASFALTNLPGALITIYRSFGANQYAIAQEISSSVGAVSICIDEAIPYTVTGTKQGYVPFFSSNNVFYRSTGTVNIPMFIGLSSPVSSPLSNIQMVLSPSAYYIQNSTGAGNTSCLVNSGDGNLISMYYIVSNSTGAYHNVSILTSIGASSTYNFTTIDRYNLQCGYIAVVNGTRYNYNITNVVWFYGNIGMAGPAGIELGKIVGAKTLMFIAIFIAMLASAYFVRFFGLTSAIVFLMLYAFIISVFNSWGVNVETGAFFVAVLIYATLTLARMG